MNSCPFPVGFGGFFQTDPSTIYSGTTWEQKKDVFILASGTVYPAGSTGGEAQHMLTEPEMPSHRHIETAGNSYSDPHGLSWLVDSASSGNGTGFQFDLHKFALWVYDVTTKTGVTQDVGVSYWSGTGDAIKTDISGGSQPHNNMPPYFTMPFWIRTS